MTTTITPFMRNALTLDAAVSGIAAVLMMGGAGFLPPWLGLPPAILFWAGAALVPFVGLLVLVAWRGRAHRLVLFDIVAINALWVAGSLGLLVSGLVEPTALGYAFVLAQAAAVALFAGLQTAGLRNAAPRPA